MNEKTERLHEAYAKQNYDCMMRKDIDGMMYWSNKIDELLRGSASSPIYTINTIDEKPNKEETPISDA